MTQLVLVLLLIGRKSGTNLLSQSRSVVNAKPITFRHSNENRSKLATPQFVRLDKLSLKVVACNPRRSSFTIHYEYIYRLVRAL